MHLYLNTSNNLQTRIKLDNQEFVTDYTSPRDQDVLGALQTALRASNKSIEDVADIEVFTGPGSFTGLRVGISIATALGFALDVPINGKPPGTVIIPQYGAAASITPPKPH